jgi:hypothetical protein
MCLFIRLQKQHVSINIYRSFHNASPFHDINIPHSNSKITILPLQKKYTSTVKLILRWNSGVFLIDEKDVG